MNHDDSSLKQNRFPSWFERMTSITSWYLRSKRKSKYPFPKKLLVEILLVRTIITGNRPLTNMLMQINVEHDQSHADTICYRWKKFFYLRQNMPGKILLKDLRRFNRNMNANSLQLAACHSRSYFYEFFCNDCWKLEDLLWSNSLLLIDV